MTKNHSWVHKIKITTCSLSVEAKNFLSGTRIVLQTSQFFSYRFLINKKISKCVICAAFRALMWRNEHVTCESDRKLCKIVVKFKGGKFFWRAKRKKVVKWKKEKVKKIAEESHKNKVITLPHRPDVISKISSDI